MPLQYFWDYILLCSFLFSPGELSVILLFQLKISTKLFSLRGNGRRQDCHFVQNTPSCLWIPMLGPSCAAPSNGVREPHFLGFCSHRKVWAGSFSNSQTKILTPVRSVWIVSVYCLSLVPADHISVLCVYKGEHASQN